MNGWMAPYSCGGVLKLAAASRTDGAVICCQGRCASNATARSGNRSIFIAVFISKHLGIPIDRLQSKSILASRGLQAFQRAAQKATGVSTIVLKNVENFTARGCTPLPDTQVAAADRREM
jgi:hypothetical protein